MNQRFLLNKNKIYHVLYYIYNKIIPVTQAPSIIRYSLILRQKLPMELH